MALRIPKSAEGKTSGRCREKIKYIWAVHTPIPFTEVSSSITSESGRPASRRRFNRPSATRAPRSRRYRIFCGDTPAVRIRAVDKERNHSGGGNPGPPCNARNLRRIAVPAAPEICWNRIACASVEKPAPREGSLVGTSHRIRRARTGSDRDRCRAIARADGGERGGTVRLPRPPNNRCGSNPGKTSRPSGGIKGRSRVRPQDAGGGPDGVGCSTGGSRNRFAPASSR